MALRLSEMDFFNQAEGFLWCEIFLFLLKIILCRPVIAGEVRPGYKGEGQTAGSRQSAPVSARDNSTQDGDIQHFIG